MVRTKKCTCCGEEKPLRCFYKRLKGHQSWCRKCMAGRDSSAGLAPDCTDKPQRRRVGTCPLCSRLPHRVVGVVCPMCGTEARPETDLRLEDFLSGGSALAGCV